MTAASKGDECQTCVPSDLVEIGAEKYDPEKEAIIRSMIRQAPGQEAVCGVVEALSAYPTDALERVRDFGTKLEIYDPNGGEEFPNYMPTLKHPQVVGAYNTVANVLGIEKDNLSPFVILHEFAHALDASLGNISDSPEWRGAHNLAVNTNQAIRDYAKHDPSEYLAENTAAYLVSDEALYGLVERGLENNIATAGLSEREYLQLHQNFSKERLERIDPQGFQLVDQLLGTVRKAPPTKPLLAMDENQFSEWLNMREQQAA